jgi:hypothetical protein
VLVEDRVLALLVRSRDELVALVLNPLPQTELVLGRSQKLRLLLGVDTALAHSLAMRSQWQGTRVLGNTPTLTS